MIEYLFAICFAFIALLIVWYVITALLLGFFKKICEIVREEYITAKKELNKEQNDQ